MTREEKSNIIEALSEKFSQNEHFYITDASGLSVAQINAFRRLCFHAGIEYGVYKNTLIRKALEKQGGANEELFKVLQGFSGVLFSKEIGNAPAKVIRDYRKGKEGKPLLKAASIDSSLFFGEESLGMLAELKSKNELIGEIISLLQSPAKNVVSQLTSGGSKLAGILKTLEEKGS